MSQRVPSHIAIIPDGNRRWATSKGLAKTKGYSKVDYEHLENLIIEAKRIGVKYMSLWFFSTENWNRPKLEVNFLFNHFSKNVPKLLEGAIKNKIRIKHFGRKDRIPKEIANSLEILESKTKDFQDFTLILCIDYGGRDEIVRSVNKILESGVSKITEKDIVDNLDSCGIPDPDLIIRTSGERRLSGFMPFQSVYSEFYFADIHFPEFTSKELVKAIEDFSNRNRRFGSN